MIYVFNAYVIFRSASGIKKEQQTSDQFPYYLFSNVFHKPLA